MTTHVRIGDLASSGTGHLPGKEDQVKTDWTSYAKSYDLLSQYNPAYLELLREFERVLATLETPRTIFDVGGGTGSYSLIAARECPESAVTLIEPDRGMLLRARENLSAHDNVTYIQSALQDFNAPGEADLVICVHALYAMPNQMDRLADLGALLRPGGTLFLVDLGRVLNVADWRSYFFSHLSKEYGFAKAVQIFWQGREIAKQNKAIVKAQKENLYWTHSGAEMAAAVEKSGFEIIEQKAVYRGYSDLLVCRATA